jgi:YD repeat-containing protein
VTSTTEGDAAEATVTVDDDRGATTRYRCTADGLFLERASTDDGTDWSTTDYEPPPRVLPATIEVGKAWTAESAVETLDSQGAATFGSAALQFEVIEAGVATVDAGTFEVLRVRVTREDASSIVEARDADVGAVAIEGAEVVALE